jgi:hypothetical protein
MTISKNRHSWCCEADVGSLDRLVLEAILPRAGLLYPLAEISLMALVVDRVRPTHIFEWGTNVGASAKLFHSITEVLGMDTAIHTWDLPEHTPHGQHPGAEHGKLVRGLSRVHFHRGDGVRGARQEYQRAKDTHPGVRVLFFVDGDHAYDSVIREVSEIISFQEEFHILAHDTFVQKPEPKGQFRESWMACATGLELSAREYRWLNVGFGSPGMTYLWGKGKRREKAGFRKHWLALLDRVETRLEKVIHRSVAKLRGR